MFGTASRRCAYVAASFLVLTGLACVTVLGDASLTRDVGIAALLIFAVGWVAHEATRKG